MLWAAGYRTYRGSGVNHNKLSATETPHKSAVLNAFALAIVAMSPSKRSRACAVQVDLRTRDLPSLIPHSLQPP